MIYLFCHFFVIDSEFFVLKFYLNFLIKSDTEKLNISFTSSAKEVCIMFH